MISTGIVTVSYIAATILFILALGGLSHQETARRGNWYGIVGMAIALFATVFGVVTQNYVELILALLAGGSIGLLLARRVQMTEMRSSSPSCTVSSALPPYSSVLPISWIRRRTSKGRADDPRYRDLPSVS